MKSACILILVLAVYIWLNYGLKCMYSDSDSSQLLVTVFLLWSLLILKISNFSYTCCIIMFLCWTFDKMCCYTCILLQLSVNPYLYRIYLPILRNCLLMTNMDFLKNTRWDYCWYCHVTITCTFPIGNSRKVSKVWSREFQFASQQTEEQIPEHCLL